MKIIIFCLAFLLIANNQIYSQNPDWVNISTLNSNLPDRYVSSLYFDKIEQSMYVGTLKKGLLLLDNLPTLNFVTFNYTISNLGISSVLFDNLRDLWIGTENSIGGLYHNKNGVLNYYNDSIYYIHHNFITDIVMDSNNNIWISTYAGISGYFERSYWMPTTQFEDYALIVYRMVVDKSNNLWLASLNHGLYRYNNGILTNYNTQNSSLPSDYVQSINTDTKGNIWIGFNAEGLAKFNDGEFKIYNSDNSDLIDNSIIAIKEDKYGNIWLASFFGYLIKIEDEKFITFDPINSGLNATIFQSLEIDNNNNIWIGTESQGIYIFREGGVILGVEDNLPISSNLESFPNPFTQTTNIKYCLPNTGKVKLVVYNALGYEAAVLVDGYKDSGGHEAVFDGSGLPSRRIFLCFAGRGGFSDGEIDVD